MPWSNQSGGGGWKGGGGGGPWGQRPPGGGSPGPDLEEMLRRGQDRLKQALPGGSSGKFLWVLVLLGVVGIWLLNCFYTVGPEEEGVVLRFGKYARSTPPGLHFIIWPIETVETPKVQEENQLNFGQVSRGGGSPEGLILAGDQNIVEIGFTVLWKIADAQKFLFNVRNPERLVGVVAESAMREIVGRTPAEEVRTRGRLEAQNQVQTLIQSTLDSYDSGILITGVKLEKADPPPAVIDAFEEVQRAEQNQNKFIREAEQYRNKLLGEARGEAAKIVEDAKAYKARIVNEAEGEAQRFVSVFDEYAKARDVTRKRLFLETLEEVFSKSNKVIIEQGQGGAGTGVVPYLPLPEVAKRRGSGTGSTTTQDKGGQ